MVFPMQHGVTRATTRRQLLHRGLLLAGVPMAALLAQACGGSGQAPPNPPTAAAAPPTAAPAKPAATSAPAQAAPTTALAKPVASPAAGATAQPAAPASGAKKGGILLVSQTT